jgi:hypothetical protein
MQPTTHLKMSGVKREREHGNSHTLPPTPTMENKSNISPTSGWFPSPSIAEASDPIPTSPNKRYKVSPTDIKTESHDQGEVTQEHTKVIQIDTNKSDKTDISTTVKGKEKLDENAPNQANELKAEGKNESKVDFDITRIVLLKKKLKVITKEEFDQELKEVLNLIDLSNSNHLQALRNLLLCAMSKARDEIVESLSMAILDLDLEKTQLYTILNFLENRFVVFDIRKCIDNKSELYCQIIKDSPRLDKPMKDSLLAKIGNSRPKFRFSMEFGWLEKVNPYMSMVLTSALKDNDQLELINAYDKNKNTGLYLAIRNGHVDVVTTFFKTLSQHEVNIQLQYELCLRTIKSGFDLTEIQFEKVTNEKTQQALKVFKDQIKIRGFEEPKLLYLFRLIDKPLMQAIHDNKEEELKESIKGLVDLYAKLAEEDFISYIQLELMLAIEKDYKDFIEEFVNSNFHYEWVRSAFFIEEINNKFLAKGGDGSLLTYAIRLGRTGIAKIITSAFLNSKLSKNDKFDKFRLGETEGWQNSCNKAAMLLALERNNMDFVSFYTKLISSTDHLKPAQKFSLLIAETSDTDIFMLRDSLQKDQEDFYLDYIKNSSLSVLAKAYICHMFKAKEEDSINFFKQYVLPFTVECLNNLNPPSAKELDCLLNYLKQGKTKEEASRLVKEELLNKVSLNLIQKAGFNEEITESLTKALKNKNCQDLITQESIKLIRTISY